MVDRKGDSQHLLPRKAGQCVLSTGPCRLLSAGFQRELQPGLSGLVGVLIADDPDEIFCARRLSNSHSKMQFLPRYQQSLPVHPEFVLIGFLGFAFP